MNLNSLSCATKLIPISEVILLPDETDTRDIKTIAQWCIDYLCNPHTDLGRSGVVCPFSPTSMKKETFWITEVKTKGMTEDKIKKHILNLLNLFLDKEPRTGDSTQFKTIVSIWSDISPEENIARLHHEMKPLFLRNGLMLGEFFNLCSKGGLRNPNFKPLRSPVPLLVVREMLEFDIAFLSESKEHVSEYIRKYGEKGFIAIEKMLNNKKIELGEKQISVLKSFL
ncbi:DUF6875 domain-containing protein [Xenorhabdus sp. SGI240]|uniref:DUF6875 domain-containing protein n=1 Tax=Xenorhabdus sp. SGI240 TaxID=3158262 RepID=UPI0032B7D149